MIPRPTLSRGLTSTSLSLYCAQPVSQQEEEVPQSWAFCSLETFLPVAVTAFWSQCIRYRHGLWNGRICNSVVQYLWTVSSHWLICWGRNRQQGMLCPVSLSGLSPHENNGVLRGNTLYLTGSVYLFDFTLTWSMYNAKVRHQPYSYTHGYLMTLIS